MTSVESMAMDVERVRPRTLPALHQYRTFGGCGSGRVCAGCGAVIPENKIEIEVEYGCGSGMELLVLHVTCFSDWLGTAGGGEWQCSQTSLR